MKSKDINKKIRKAMVFFLHVVVFSALSNQSGLYAESEDAKYSMSNHDEEKILDKMKNDLAIIEHLGDKVPFDIDVVTSEGKKQKIKSFFNVAQPVIVVPVYYRCPHLCSLILDGLTDSIVKEKDYILGRDYQILVFSINPSETVTDAANRKAEYIERISEEKRIDAQKGWHFVTLTSKENIKKMTGGIGFGYKKIDGGDYAHSAALMFTNSKGELSRYLYGIQHSEIDFRLALLGTTDTSKIHSLKDKILMFCFKYVPEKRRYTVIAWRIMFICLSISFVLIAIFVGVMLKIKDRK